MKKGDTIYVKITVGALPVCSAFSGKILYITKVMGEERKARIQVEKTFSFSRGFEIANHKTTVSLLVPAIEIFTDRQMFIDSILNSFINFNQILLVSGKEIINF